MHFPAHLQRATSARIFPTLHIPAVLTDCIGNDVIIIFPIFAFSFYNPKSITKKKTIIFISALVAFILLYFYLFKVPSKRELQEQINQLQQEVAALQEMNGLPSSYETDSVVATKPSYSKQEKSKQSASKKTNSDNKNTVKTAQKSNEEVAVEAIQYCLKMYVPDLKYTNIRSMPKSDGTVDVIIDFKEKYTGNIEHTYYNITVYSNKEFRVNSCRGDSDGDFPHHSKMMLP